MQKQSVTKPLILLMIVKCGGGGRNQSMKRPYSDHKYQCLQASQALSGHHFSLGIHPFLYTVLYTVNSPLTTRSSRTTSRNMRSGRSSAITRQQAGIKTSYSRLRSRGALWRLEPDEGKLSRPVLRGGSGGNAAPLPDQSNTQKTLPLNRNYCAWAQCQ